MEIAKQQPEHDAGQCAEAGNQPAFEKENADDLVVLGTQVAQGAHIVFLVDDEHGHGADDVETGHEENEGEEEVGDEFFHFHDAEHVGLLLVAVFHGEAVAKDFLYVFLGLPDVRAVLELELNGRHAALLAEKLAGEP